MSAEEWAAIPETVDHTLKYKVKRFSETTFVPLPDSFIQDKINKSSLNGTLEIQERESGTETSMEK